MTRLMHVVVEFDVELHPGSYGDIIDPDLMVSEERDMYENGEYAIQELMEVGLNYESRFTLKPEVDDARGLEAGESTS